MGFPKGFPRSLPGYARKTAIALRDLAHEMRGEAGEHGFLTRETLLAMLTGKQAFEALPAAQRRARHRPLKIMRARAAARFAGAIQPRLAR